MEAALAALADPARWRLVTRLAERPRSVGVLAQLAKARQPQTTKHLQTLERAGLVTSQRTGQRRIYALRPAALRELAAALDGLADTAERADGPVETFERYGGHLQAERDAADRPGWADGRAFRFSRALPGDPAQVWRFLTDPALLGQWWVPDGLRVDELTFDARPGGRIVLQYGEAEDTAGAEPVVGRAEGVVEEAVAGRRLAYRTSALLPEGGSAFTALVTFDLRPGQAATGLEVHYLVKDSVIGSADFIAGIEIGFGQSLDKLAVCLAAEPTRTTNPPGSTSS